MISTIPSLIYFLLYFIYIYLYYSSRQDDDSYQNFVPFVGVSTFCYTTVQTFVVIVRFFKAIYLNILYFMVSIDQFNANKK